MGWLVVVVIFSGYACLSIVSLGVGDSIRCFFGDVVFKLNFCFGEFRLWMRFF